MEKTVFTTIKSLIVIYLGLLGIGCQQPNDGNNEGTQQVTVEIVHPRAGEAINPVDTVEISVSAPIYRLQLLVDSLVVKTFFSTPYTFQWAAGYWADGQQHLLSAIAYDNENRVIGKDEISVQVQETVRLVPDLISPITDAIFMNPDNIQFTWQSVLEARTYEVQIAKNATFSQNVQSYAVMQTSINLPITTEGRYYWRVRAIHESGKVGPWSIFRKFEVREVVLATLSSIQAKVFDKRCAIPNCHVGEYAAQGLDLSQGNSYEHLVYVKSFEVPSMYLVEPFASGKSYLITKLEGGDSLQGAQMPLTGEKLEAAIIDSIKRWIDIGAPQN